MDIFATAFGFVAAIFILALTLPTILMLMATPFVLIGAVIWQVVFGVYDLFRKD